MRQCKQLPKIYKSITLNFTAMDQQRMIKDHENKMRIASIVVMLKCAIIDGRMPHDWDGSSDTDLVEYLNEHYNVTPKSIDDHIGI